MLYAKNKRIIDQYGSLKGRGEAMMKPNKYCGKLDVGYGMGWREESGWNREERMTGEERKESRWINIIIGKSKECEAKVEK